jgi:hypothetical protein
MPDYQPHRGGLDKNVRRTFLRTLGTVGGSVVFTFPVPAQRPRVAESPGQDFQRKAPAPNSVDPEAIDTMAHQCTSTSSSRNRRQYGCPDAHV